MRTSITLAALCALALSSPVSAADPARAMISIYHAAPGHQTMLLQWLAEQDRIAAAAGVPKSQLYVHTDGASWDYLMVAPVTTAAQDAAADAAAKRLGLVSGPAAGIEFRKHIADHTDTMVMGPMSAAEYLALVGSK